MGVALYLNLSTVNNYDEERLW